MPKQDILLLAFGAGYDDICFAFIREIIQRDPFSFVLCIPTGGKGDVLCPEIRVGAIEGRKTMPFRFRNI